MKTVFRPLLLSAALAAVSGLTQAQTPDNPPPPGGASPDATRAPMPHQSHASGKGEGSANVSEAAVMDPTAFVKAATMGGMIEVELAKLALSKSKDAAIRSFADRMVKDHGKTQTDLAALAKAKGFDVPTSLAAQDQNMVKAAARKSGDEFDVWYSKQMVIEHDKAVALFQAAASGTDVDFAGFAKKTLPALEEHKQLAQALPGAFHP